MYRFHGCRRLFALLSLAWCLCTTGSWGQFSSRVGEQASPDGRFALELRVSTATTTVSLTRGPYLQSGSSTGVTIKWRTGEPATSRVAYNSLLPNGPAMQVTNLTTTTEHEVTLSGLKPNTTYAYRVQAGDEVLAGQDGSCHFTTPPAPGETKPTRIWVIGDSGTGGEGPIPSANAQAVRDGFYHYAGARGPDLWLMLGDNAYPNGSDEQHQLAVFDMYPDTLRTVVLWPTLGNHETYTINPATHDFPYYDIFKLPAHGESGGVPSGAPAYYSFDDADIHFVCLDSSVSDSSSDGPMLTWLKRDLAAASARWTIAFFHHPPYSKGSHDSDNPAADGYLQFNIRQNALPILEAGGVDLVLSGHSHGYERSFLLNGHYGLSNTLTGAMILNHGDGREGGDGGYVKPTVRGPGQGTVYTVVGCSGKLTPGSLNHPVMSKSLLVLGSMVIDIDGRRLNARFIDTGGAILDEFTIWKGPPQTTAAPQWQAYR